MQKGNHKQEWNINPRDAGVHVLLYRAKKSSCKTVPEYGLYDCLSSFYFEFTSCFLLLQARTKDVCISSSEFIRLKTKEFVGINIIRKRLPEMIRE